MNLQPATPPAGPDAQAGADPLRRLFQALPSGMAHCRMLYDGDRPVDWVFLDANAAFTHQTGLRDVVGTRMTETLPGIRQADPELFEAFGRVARGGPPERFEMHLQALDAWFDVSVYGPAPEEFVAVFDAITERKRMEASLRHTELLLREAQRIGNVGAWEFDIATGRQVWSEEVYRIHEVDPDFQPTVETALSFYAPEDREKITAAVRRAIETGEPFDLQLPFTTARGNPRWMHAIGERDWKHGKVRGFFQDVTDRRRDQTVLQVSEERLRLAMQATQQGWFDLNLKTGEVAVSREFARIVGDQPSGAPMTYQTWVDSIHRDDLPGVLQRFRDCLESGETRQMEYRMRTRSGAWKWILSAARVVARDAAGMPVRMTGTHADITERKTAVEALRESEARFRLLAENATDMISLHGPDGSYNYASPACLRLTGYAPEELIGRSAYAFIVAEDHPAVRASHSTILDGEAVTTVQYRLRRKDGTQAWVETTSRTLHDPGSGEVVEIQAATRDITDRVAAERRQQETEAALQHLQRMESIGRLAGGVAHDMNNVLAAIMAVATLQQDAGGDTARQASLILQACLRGRTLVKGLTDFARKDVQETQVLDLNALVLQEAEILRSTTRRQVDLHLDLDPDLPRLAGSPTALSNALMNLCVNALDAMPEGGTLTLGTARLPDRHLELSVRDTGDGMPAEVLARATEPFFTTKPMGKGTGLGLSVVFGTVQAHGGTLHLESRPGAGTVVRLRLPSVGGSDSAQAQSRPSATAPRGPSRRVLLVDDDTLVRQTTSALLESQGHQVTAVSSGAEAMELLAKGADVEVLILDQAMPGMTGVDVLRSLRGLGLQIPVLLATGFADENLRAQLASGGRVALLPKPYTGAELQEALKALF